MAGKLIRAQTYAQATGIVLPVVAEATCLNLDREISLFRALVANGLSKTNDNLVAQSLMAIGHLLSKSQRVSRVPLIAKDDLLAMAKVLAKITRTHTGLDTKTFEKEMIDAIKKAANQPDDL